MQRHLAGVTSAFAGATGDTPTSVLPVGHGGWAGDAVGPMRRSDGAAAGERRRDTG